MGMKNLTDLLQGEDKTTIESVIRQSHYTKSEEDAVRASYNNRIATLETSQVEGVVGYETQAALYDDLSPNENTVALVTNDPNPDNNGNYRKVGVSGEGSWVQSSFDRVSAVENNIIDITQELSEKVSLTIIGDNLFNKNADDVTYGYYITAEGVLYESSDYNTTGYIPVSGNITYSQSFSNNIVWYDSSKSVISGVSSSNNTGTNTAPNNAKFIRCAVAASNFDTFMFNKGTSVLSYKPYTKLLDSSILYDGIIESNMINAKAVNREKVDFINNGKNLFDKSKVTIGKYMLRNGSLGVSANYCYSDYIKVDEGETYSLSVNTRFITFFDSSFTAINYGIEYVDSFTVPAGIAYVVVSPLIDDIDKYQVEIGSITTAYEPFLWELDDYIYTQPKAKSVGIDEFALLTAGKNKFNKLTITEGKYMSESGYIGVAQVYSYSGFIEVKPNTSYVCNHEVRFITFFNDTLKNIPGGNSTFTKGFTTTADTKYVVVTFIGTDKDTLQVEEGSSSTTYETYGYVLYDNNFPIRVVTTSDSEITIGPIQYTAVNKEICIFTESIAKNYLHNVPNLIVNIPGAKVTGRSTKLLPSSVGDTQGTVQEYSGDFEKNNEHSFTLKVTSDQITTPLIVQNIGDSYTGRMTWANNILNSAASENLNFVGVRNAGVAPIKCDGQGGWTIDNFFTVDSGGNLSQFMQPVNNYLYFGKTSFWIDANSANPTYNAATFNDAKLLFDATTGLKISPNIGDIMSNSTDSYIKWNGSEWEAIDISVFGGFEFNYGKFRQAWNIPSPDILFVLLGTNDFAGSSRLSFNNDYSKYKALYDQLIESVKADSPNTKIVVSIPVSSGRQGKNGTPITEGKKVVFFLLAKNLIMDFANRESENIYLLDYHSIVDRVYGFPIVAEPPFIDYDSNYNDEFYLEDTVHLSFSGFRQMGNAYMGIIQYLRSL